VECQCDQRGRQQGEDGTVGRSDGGSDPHHHGDVHRDEHRRQGAYATALLITMSISYRRYLRTATPIAPNRNMNARPWSTDRTGGGLEEPAKNAGRNVAITRTPPVTNHFSWRRSSPRDRRNRTTVAATATRSETRKGKTTARTTTPLRSLLDDDWLNGWPHTRVERSSRSAVSSPVAAAASHAAARHRRVS